MIVRFSQVKRVCGAFIVAQLICWYLGENSFCYSHDITSKEMDRALYVIASHRNSAEKIRSGSLDIEGNVVDNDPKWGKLEGRVNIFMAFDISQSLLRFDRTEPARIADGASPLTTSNWKVGMTGGRFARNTTSVIFKRHDDSIANLFPVGHQSPPWIKAFDIRSLGVIHEGDILAGRSYDQVCDSYDKMRPSEIVDEGDLVKVTWRFPSLDKRCVWFDSRKGYWPVKLALFRADKVGADGNPVWKEAMSEYSVAVQELDGVFLPVGVRFLSDYGQRTESLRFKWRGVNSPVNRKLFSVEGIDAGDITFVVDRTGGEPISERIHSSVTLPRNDRATAYFKAVTFGIAFGIVLFFAWKTWRKAP